MPEQPTIIVQQSQRNDGCFGGCGTAIAVVFLLGLAVEYWYISAGLAVIGIAAGAWFMHTRTAASPELPAAPARPPVFAEHPESPVAPAAERRCAGCGAHVSGNFCGECGAAQSRTCSGCGQRGLQSDFCPTCGYATYTPPTG